MAEVFRIEIVASPRQAQAGIAQVSSSLEQLNRTAASTNGLLRGALQLAGITSGIVLVQRLVSNLVDLSDTYTQIQNRLTVVTSGTEELSRVTEDLLGIANRSRTGFEATAQLYARTALATRDLGTSQQELLGITETVNKAIILSGASAKEANNGLIQLSQAIASNRLAGDELRSVLEQLPVVADVIAKQLGVTRGELRGLGQEGAITAKVILDGFRAASADIEKRFAKTVPTIGQSLQILQNNSIALIGALNKATGASQTFASVLTFIGRNLDLLLAAGPALILFFNADRIIRYTQSIFEAAQAQKFFAGVGSDVLAIVEAEAAAQVNAARADVLKTESLLASAQANQVAAAAVSASVSQTVADISANIAAAKAYTVRADAAIAAAEAELAVARAGALNGAEAAYLAGVEAQIQVVRENRLLANQALAASEVELEAAQAASVLAAQGLAAAETELVARQSELIASNQILAKTQEETALSGTKVLSPFSRLVKFAAANPFGIAALAVATLAGALIGVPEILSTLGDGLQLVLGAGQSLVDVTRSLASLLPGVGKNLQDLAKIALIGSVAVAVFAGVTSGILITIATVAALGIALGQLKRAFDDVGEAERALTEVKGLAPLGEEILVNQRSLRSLEAQYAELREQLDSGNTPKGLKATIDAYDRTGTAIDLVKKKLAELEAEARRIQGTDKRAKEVENAFTKRLAFIQEEISLLGKSRVERELGVEVLREQTRIEKELKAKLTPDQSSRLRTLIEEKQAAEDLARLLDDIEPPGVEFQRQVQIIDKAFDDGRLTVEQYNKAVRELEQRRLDASPLSKSLAELRDQFRNLQLPELQNPPSPFGEDPAKQLEDLRAITRERDIQVEIATRLNELNLTDAERATARPQIEALVRQNAALERQQGLTEELVQQRAELSNAGKIALLPDFEQGIQSQIQALQLLNDVIKDPAAEEAFIRRNAALQELGGILNGLQSPLLAQKQAQDEVAGQLARLNQLQAEGALTAQQYAIGLQELEFRAQAVSTTFGDGLSVASQQMAASITEATVAQTAFTSAINAASSASAEFVQTGSVDFRKLALNIIAEISRVITQLLVLRAIKAIAGFGGPSGGQSVDSLGTTLASTFVAAPGLLAEGGQAQANKPFIVGEDGPELFVPGRTGTVVPNDQVSTAFADAPRNASAPVVVPAPEITFTNINVADMEAAALAALATPAGSRVTLNHITNNPNTVARSIGR